MCQSSFTYKTIEDSEETLLKIKGSKFYGYGFNINSEEEVKLSLEKIKKLHPQAKHHCYAYRFGFDVNQRKRMNDAGEPNYSAGKPIYGQIESFELDNVLIVVVRYFGGVKLGVGGLISAYKESAKITIESTNYFLTENTADFEIEVDYDNLGRLEKYIESNGIEVLEKSFANQCFFKLRIKISQKSNFEREFIPQ